MLMQLKLIKPVVSCVLILSENEISPLCKNLLFLSLSQHWRVRCAHTLPQDTGRPGSAAQLGVKTFALSELREQLEHSSITITGKPIKLLQSGFIV